MSSLLQPVSHSVRASTPATAPYLCVIRAQSSGGAWPASHCWPPLMLLLLREAVLLELLDPASVMLLMKCGWAAPPPPPPAAPGAPPPPPRAFPPLLPDLLLPTYCSYIIGRLVGRCSFQ